MKLTDPISSKSVDRFAGCLLAVGIVLLLIAGVLRLLGEDSFKIVGLTGVALGIFGARSWDFIGDDVRRDEARTAFNQMRREAQAKRQAGVTLTDDEALLLFDSERRVGTSRWAYYGLAFAIGGIVLLIVIPALT